MSRKVVPPHRAPKPAGPYSQAVRAGNLVFVSGQIPVVPETGEVIRTPIEEAVKRCFANIEAVLSDAGLSLSDVVMVHLYLADMNDFERVNELYAGFFPSEPPARVTLEAARLPLDVPLEIEVVAFSERSPRP